MKTMKRNLARDGRPNRGRPTNLRLERRADRRLWAVRDGDERPVRPRPLFHWSREGGHVSLRDRQNQEFAAVAESLDLEEGSRAALEEALMETGFLFQVTRVLEVKEEVEVRAWRVETRQGARTFQTRLDDWPRAMPDGGLLVRDVAGDLYHVPRPDTLDRTSREGLWAFVD
jgi:hypothetical protein